MGPAFSLENAGPAFDCYCVLAVPDIAFVSSTRLMNSARSPPGSSPRLTSKGLRSCPDRNYRSAHRPEVLSEGRHGGGSVVGVRWRVARQPCRQQGRLPMSFDESPSGAL